MWRSRKDDGVCNFIKTNDFKQKTSDNSQTYRHFAPIFQEVRGFLSNPPYLFRAFSHYEQKLTEIMAY